MEIGSRRVVRRARGAALLAALLVLPACFAYHEAEITTIPAGAQVRAHLSPSAVDRLRDRLVRPDTLVEGVVVGRTGQGLEIDAYGMSWPAGTVAPPLTQRFTFAPADVTRLEVRRLDTARTVGVALAGGIVAGLIVNRLFGGAGGSRGGDSGGGGDNSLAPAPAGALRP